MVLRGSSMKVSWVILQASPQFHNIKSRFYCMNMQALEQRRDFRCWDSKELNGIIHIVEDLS